LKSKIVEIETETVSTDINFILTQKDTLMEKKKYKSFKRTVADGKFSK